MDHVPPHHPQRDIARTALQNCIKRASDLGVVKSKPPATLLMSVTDVVALAQDSRRDWPDERVP